MVLWIPGAITPNRLDSIYAVLNDEDDYRRLSISSSFSHMANVRFNPFISPYVYIRVQNFVIIPNFFQYFHEPDNGTKSHTS